CEQLPDDALLHLAPDLGAFGRDGVDLVKKDDAGRALLGVGKDPPQLCLALAIELVDDLRPADTEEVRAALRRDRAGDQRFASAGRAVEQDALGWLDAEAVEEFGVAERQLD